MTAKEKATELVEKYLNLEFEKGGQFDGYLSMQLQEAKQCALIAVEEIIKEVNQNFTSDRYAYWNSVKTEINAL